jgi:hypothetical protein
MQIQLYRMVRTERKSRQRGIDAETASAATTIA